MMSDSRSLDARAGPPLEGILVLDVGGIGPGPFCAMVLAGLGASVIRLERPSSGQTDYGVDPFAAGRKTLHVDLKTEEGRAAAQILATKADILIEGFRPGVAERLGFGPEACRKINPRLVYGRITGWGQSGPLAARAGHDINYIALSGALHAIGTLRHGPVVPLNLLGDFAGGSFFLAIGVLAALFERQRSGQGQVVDAAIIDGAAALMWFIYALRGSGQWQDRRESNALDGGVPWYGVYETSDRRHISIGAIEDVFYDELLRVTGLAQEPLPPRTDPAGWPVLRARFTELFRTRTQADWCALLEGADACFAPVLSMSEAPYHPHVAAREIFDEGGGVTLPRIVPTLARSPTYHGFGTPSLSPIGEGWALSSDEAALIGRVAQSVL